MATCEGGSTEHWRAGQMPRDSEVLKKGEALCSPGRFSCRVWRKIVNNIFHFITHKFVYRSLPQIPAHTESSRLLRTLGRFVFLLGRVVDRRQVLDHRVIVHILRQSEVEDDGDDHADLSKTKSARVTASRTVERLTR